MIENKVKSNFLLSIYDLYLIIKFKLKFTREFNKIFIIITHSLFCLIDF